MFAISIKHHQAHKATAVLQPQVAKPFLFTSMHTGAVYSCAVFDGCMPSISRHVKEFCLTHTSCRSVTITAWAKTRQDCPHLCKPRKPKVLPGDTVPLATTRGHQTVDRSQQHRHVPPPPDASFQWERDAVFICSTVGQDACSMPL